jgi:prepilin-type N-terminal cleavage/methylation domain-containing protein
MKKKKSFTLIELLVVIAIIAVLVAILLPGLQQARAQAQRVACSSNWHQIGIMVVSYLNDNHDRYFPTHGIDWRCVWDWPYPPQYPQNYWGFGRLKPYANYKWFEDDKDHRGPFTDPTCAPPTEVTFANVLYILPFTPSNSGPGEYWNYPKPIPPEETSTAALGICFVNGNPWDYHFLIPAGHSGEGCNALKPDGHVSWVPKERFYEHSPETNNPWIKLKGFNGY